jgi:hypothetical protein
LPKYPHLSQRSLQYQEVLKLDIEDIKTSKISRELRLKIRDNRTKGIDKWHKDTKDLFLRGGQFVDAIKKLESAVNISIESNLEGIEKHYEIKQAKIKESLRIDRVFQLEDFKKFVPMGLNFGEMAEEEFTKILNGAKLQHEDKIKKEAEKAEADRLRKIEDEDKAEKERQRIKDQQAENERLKQEAEKEAKKLAKAEADRLAIIKENKRIQDKKDAELKALKDEMQAKKDADDAKAEADRLAVIEAKKQAEKLAKAPIKKQMTAWINSFEIPQTSIENEKVKGIQEKFEAFKAWALKETESL